MGRFTLFFSALAVGSIALLGGACGDDPKRPGVLADGPAQPGLGGSSSSREAGTTEAGLTDAGACTDLANTGDEIPQTAVIDDVPAGKGGPLVDGIYHLKEARLHQGAGGLPGPTGYLFQGTIRLTGQLYERAFLLKSSGGASSEVRSSGSFIPNGVNGTIALSCPSSSQEQVAYTATNDLLTLSNLVTKESFVFERKP
jgi:hypothetical protein